MQWWSFVIISGNEAERISGSECGGGSVPINHPRNPKPERKTASDAQTEAESESVPYVRGLIRGLQHDTVAWKLMVIVPCSFAYCYNLYFLRKWDWNLFYKHLHLQLKSDNNHLVLVNNPLASYEMSCLCSVSTTLHTHTAQYANYCSFPYIYLSTSTLFIYDVVIFVYTANSPISMFVPLNVCISTVHRVVQVWFFSLF